MAQCSSNYFILCQFLCYAMLCLGGCQSNWAPVSDINRASPKLSGEHIVQSNETLYAISWRYNRDYRELAENNDIKPPYKIYEGQKISLEANKAQVAQTQAAPVIAASAVVAAPSDQAGVWRWPVKGEIIGRFAKTKGLDIAGKEGEVIHAAGKGRVVYSGTGLRGYGQLLIIKHNEQYLSAYAHNQHLMVKEGDWVTIGQPIAKMGKTDTNRVKLHFEIRKNGKPVDPLRYLPK